MVTFQSSEGPAPTHVGSRRARSLACGVAFTCAALAISTGVSSAERADVGRVSGYEEYSLDGVEVCGTLGTLYTTTTSTATTVTNQGQFTQDKVSVRDTFDFVPTDPTQTGYSGISVYVRVFNWTMNTFVGLAEQQAVLHGTDGTTLRTFYIAPFVFANGEVRVNISTLRFDDCPTG